MKKVSRESLDKLQIEYLKALKLKEETPNDIRFGVVTHPDSKLEKAPAPEPMFEELQDTTPELTTPISKLDRLVSEAGKLGKSIVISPSGEVGLLVRSQTQKTTSTFTESRKSGKNKTVVTTREVRRDSREVIELVTRLTASVSEVLPLYSSPATEYSHFNTGRTFKEDKSAERDVVRGNRYTEIVIGAAETALEMNECERVGEVMTHLGAATIWAVWPGAFAVVSRLGNVLDVMENGKSILETKFWRDWEPK